MNFLFNRNDAVCGVCNTIFNLEAAILCTKCKIKIHSECGELDLATEDALICALCARGHEILLNQRDCFEKQKVAAAKMTKYSTAKFPPLFINDCITVSVPAVDRGPLDFQSIFGIVVDARNGVYQIGTKDGLIKGWFPRSDLQKSETVVVLPGDVPTETLLTLREAATKQSLCGGQGYKKCNCKQTQTQCSTNKCSCFKSKVMCNSRCHRSSTCSNK